MIAEVREPMTQAVTLSARLSASSVQVAFDGVLALDGVSLDVDQGEILGLIGPNGAGKTTLVDVISGFRLAARGVVHLNGEDITTWSAARRARHGLVRTFQGARCFPDLTILENIEAAALSHARSGRSAARRRSLALLGALRLSDHKDRPAKALTYGLLRRLAVARALALEPTFLLLDEPAAGLDESETSQLGELLLQVRADHGCGMVLVEHDVPLVMRTADRVQVLVSGSTLALGTPASVSMSPSVIEAYLGDSVGGNHDA